MMIIRDRERLAAEGPLKLAQDCLKEFGAQLPRLERLQRYYLGRHDVLARERSAGLPNLRLTHSFPRYIAQVSAGWLLGEPVRYQAKGGEGMEDFLELLDACQSELADSSLAAHQAIYGRAVSLCYQSGGGRAGLAPLDPRSAFVVYDDTVERRPLMGVLRQQGADGRALHVYTEQSVLHYARDAEGGAHRLIRALPHDFGRVPMVEYLNGHDEHSDFEDVLPLIDAYDLLSSDRLNDRAQFADALLVLTGVMGIGTADSPGDRRGPAQRLREDRTLALPDSDAKAEWLLKNPVERDIDVLRRALAEDIHKFSMTPDFLDERFAGNLSGVAIRYKLFCLEQKTRLKERWFVGGLRERARLLCHWLTAQGLRAPDPERLSIQIPRHLPESDLERAQTIRNLAGLQSKRSLRAHSPLPDEQQTE